MNIFILDNDISKSVEALCDKHIVKMVLETAQLLCSVYPSGAAPYKKTHYNHPCAVWAGSSAENFDWLVNYGMAICDEYSFRYGKVHKSRQVIEWCKNNKPLLPSTGLTPFAQAMPPEFKDIDAVVAYRNYYKSKKKDIAKWNNGRQPPHWW